MRDLTQHLTTRADDSHAAPVIGLPEGHSQVSKRFPRCQIQVRFFALRRIKPHAPPLVRAPVNSFEFQPWPYSPGGTLNALAAAQQGSIPATPSVQRLLRGLPGYLILFAPHAFAHQRQYWSRKSPSPPVFLLISTHFTATPGIPLPSPILKSSSFKCTSGVEPRAFTSDLPNRLRAPYAQ